MTTVYYHENSHVVRIEGLRNEKTGAYINDATATVTLQDASGNNLAGHSWPKEMEYVDGSDGIYETSISHELGTTSLTGGRAVIRAESVDGLVYKVTVQLKFATRRE